MAEDRKIIIAPRKFKTQKSAGVYIETAEALKKLTDSANAIKSRCASIEGLVSQLSPDMSENDKTMGKNHLSRLNQAITTPIHEFLTTLDAVIQTICARHGVSFNEKAASFSIPSSKEHPYYEEIANIYNLLQSYLPSLGKINRFESWGIQPFIFNDFVFPPSDIYEFKLNDHRFVNCKIGLDLSDSELSNVKISHSVFTQKSVVRIAEIVQKENQGNSFNGAFNFQELDLLESDERTKASENETEEQEVENNSNNNLGETQISAALSSFVNAFKLAYQNSPNSFEIIHTKMNSLNKKENIAQKEIAELLDVLKENPPLLYTWSSFVSMVLGYPEVLNHLENLDIEKTCFDSMIDFYKVIFPSLRENQIVFETLSGMIEKLSLETKDLNSLTESLMSKFNSNPPQKVLALAGSLGHYRKELAETPAGHQSSHSSEANASAITPLSPF